MLEGREYTPRESMKHVGYVAEDVIPPNIKVRELLEAFAPSSSTLEYLAGSLKLTEHLDKKYMELSAGLRKRVQIAIALLKDPRLILFDEPFSNLDVSIIPAVKKLLEELKSKAIVVVTSHIWVDMDVDTITILDQGRLLYHGDSSIVKQSILFDVEVEGEKTTVDLDSLNKIIHPVKIHRVKASDPVEAVLQAVRDKPSGSSYTTITPTNSS